MMIIKTIEESFDQYLFGGIDMSKKFENMTINQLKEEYIKYAFGAMIYGVKTENKRNELSEEIERREKIITSTKGISGNR